ALWRCTGSHAGRGQYEQRGLAWPDDVVKVGRLSHADGARATAKAMHHELAEHLAYVSDAHRLERFDSALREIVRAGQTVLDLGSGTGMLGLLALRAGAARVIAVDEGRMIEVARETFRAAGLAD